MVTHNNWLRTNIKERIDNKKSNFSVDFFPYKFTHLSFQEECNITCTMLSKKYSSIFIGLSGGIDSEFLCQIFHRNQIKFTPIITVYEDNSKESFYAFEFCKKNNLSPIVLELDQIQVAKIIQKDIVEKLNGVGFYSVGAIAAARYAEKSGDVFIEAQHIFGDGEELIQNFDYYLAEWDFYNTVLVKLDIVPFFLYRLELVASMLKEVNEEFVNWKNLKSCVFDCPIREKIRPEYGNKIQKLNSLFLLRNRKNNPTFRFDFGKFYNLWEKINYANVQKSS